MLVELRVSLSSCPDAECGALARGTGLGRGFRFLSFSQGGLLSLPAVLLVTLWDVSLHTLLLLE